MPEDFLLFSKGDEEFNRSMKNARRKFDIPMQATVLCKTPVNTKAESCSEVTLYRMILVHTQYSLNKDHQHLK